MLLGRKEHRSCHDVRASDELLNSPLESVVEILEAVGKSKTGTYILIAGLDAAEAEVRKRHFPRHVPK